MAAKDIVGLDIPVSMETDGAVCALKTAGRKPPGDARAVAQPVQIAQASRSAHRTLMAVQHDRAAHCRENAMADGIAHGERCLGCCFRTKADAIAAVKRASQSTTRECCMKNPAARRMLHTARKWPRPRKIQIRKQEKELRVGHGIIHRQSTFIR